VQGGRPRGGARPPPLAGTLTIVVPPRPPPSCGGHPRGAGARPRLPPHAGSGGGGSGGGGGGGGGGGCCGRLQNRRGDGRALNSVPSAATSPSHRQHGRWRVRDGRGHRHTSSSTLIPPSAAHRRRRSLQASASATTHGRFSAAPRSQGVCLWRREVQWWHGMPPSAQCWGLTRLCGRTWSRRWPPRLCHSGARCSSSGRPTWLTASVAWPMASGGCRGRGGRTSGADCP